MKISLILDAEQVDEIVCKVLKKECKLTQKYIKQWPNEAEDGRELLVHFRAVLEYFGGTI